MPEQPTLPELGLLYQQAACGLLLTDTDGTVLRVNATFCEWLGYPEHALPEGIKFQQLLTVGARMFHQTHWQPLLQLQGSVSEVKMDFRHRLGQKVPMVVNARVHTLADGRSFHSVAAFMATDRDRYEQELLKTRADAVELFRQRTSLQEEANDRSLFAEQMIGIVSHDLRNPLTAIRMGAEMLVLDETEPKRLRLAGRINQSVDRALALISDLLDFTLTRTGRSLAINKRRIRFHEVVANGVEELRLAFPAVSLLHKTKGPTIIAADPPRLTQVLGNLVANAERYGDRTRPITIVSSVIHGVASLQVHNFGQPITADVLPTLFQAMTRGTHDAGGGVGLGLYIVSEIAKGHGGQPTAESDVIGGTSIGIEFPADTSPTQSVHTRKKHNAPGPEN
ncbi:MAG: PAS domain-containing sensor histidine kinase [Pseudoxanthomonas sp.]